MKGFTLLELLIVIGILAILATIVILVLNPAEFLRQGRDTQRINDLAGINKALVWLQADQPNASFGSSNTVYTSLPDTSPTCASYSLPSLPSGWSYSCKTQANYRKTDSTGWIPVNLTNLFSTGPPFAQLPIDPINTSANGLYYTYTAGGSWELTAIPESKKYKLGGSADATDKITGAIVSGSNLSLSPIFNSNGLVGYWKFDEGNGTTAQDSSENGNSGTLGNGPTWTAESNCKAGKCLSFDGSNDYVIIPHHNSIDFGFSDFSIVMWIKASKAAGDDYPINKGSPGWGTPPNAATGYAIRLINANSWTFVLSDNNGAFNAGFGSGTSLNNWFHLAAVADRNADNSFNLSTYLNSQSTGGGNSGIKNTIATTGDLQLGPLSLRYQGLIDDVRIYNRALSAAEIKAIYDATK